MKADPQRVGPFRVIRKLGQGGMGVVFEVQDPDMPRTLALKLILSSNASKTALERFWREADVLSKVQHRNVVRLHQTGEAREGPYLVMERVQGESLKALIAKGPVQPRRAAEIIQGVAEGVAAVHAHGILHRDIKPDNVIVEPSGVPILLDFGLARDENAEQLTRTGTTLGTLYYMSPEQAQGKRTSELGPPSDVFSLGVVLYEMLLSRPPFDGSAVEVIGKILMADPVWPSQERDRVPKALDAICRKAMRKAPDERYVDATAFVEDLQRFLAGERPIALGELPRRGARVVAALVVILLAIAGTLAWVASPRGPSAQEVLALGAAAEKLLGDEEFLARRGAEVEAIAARLEEAEAWAPPADDARDHERALAKARALVGIYALARGELEAARQAAAQLGDSRSQSAAALRGCLLAQDSGAKPRDALGELGTAIRRGVACGEVRAWRVEARGRVGFSSSAAAEETLKDTDWLARVRGEQTEAEGLLRLRALLALRRADEAWSLLEAMTDAPDALRWEVGLLKVSSQLDGSPAAAAKTVTELPQTKPPKAAQRLARRSLQVTNAILVALGQAERDPMLPIQRLGELCAHLRIVARLTPEAFEAAFVDRLLRLATGIRDAEFLPLTRTLAEILPDSLKVQREVGLLAQRQTFSRPDREALLQNLRKAMVLSENSKGRKELHYHLCVLLDRLNLSEDCARECTRLLGDLDEPSRKANVLKARASAYNRMAKYQRAIEDIDEALELLPTEDSFWWVKAYAHKLLKQRDAANAAALKYLQADPQEGRRKGVVLMWELREPGAWDPNLREELETYAAGNGAQSADWAIRSAYLQLGAGDTASAGKTLRRALKLVPNSKHSSVRGMATAVRELISVIDSDPAQALKTLEGMVIKLELTLSN